MAETAKKRVRRTKEVVINEKISKLDSMIANYTEKIKKLKEEKVSLEAELVAIEEEKKKALEEESMRKIAKLLKDKNMSVEDLENLIS